MGNAQRQHHLVLPQRDGVDDSSLDLLGHHRVIGLDQPDLGPHLDGNIAGQLQIVQLFLKPVAEIGQIAGRLCILGQLGALGFLLRSLQVVGADLGQLLFAGQNVHRQLLEVDKVQLIHLVQHRDVLHQGDLMILQLSLDALNILVGAVVAGLELFDAVGGLFKEAEDALGLLGTGIKALQLGNQARNQLAGFPHVLRLDARERRLGKIAQLFLAGSTVLQHHLGVGDVDLLSEVIHHLLLLGGEGGILNLHGGRLFALLDDLFIRSGVQRQRGGRRGGVKGQGRGGGDIQFIVQISHWVSSFLISIISQGSGSSGYCPAPQYQ